VVATKYRPPAHHAFHRAKPEVEVVEGWDHVSGAGKVNLICRELRAVMMSKSRDKYMLPILTTFARETPARLEEGLALIVEDANSKQLLLKSHHVQSNIKYFVFLVSADELFDTALGMYDFNLARAVARQSQKDPRQYQPLLEEFESIGDPVVQRYRVNLHLGRIAKALEALSEILQKQQYKEFTEYADLADKHDLQEHALSLLPKRGIQQVRNSLMLSLGNRLLKVDLFPNLCWCAVFVQYRSPPRVRVCRRRARAHKQCKCSCRAGQRGRRRRPRQLARQRTGGWRSRLRRAKATWTCACSQQRLPTTCGMARPKKPSRPARSM